MEYREREKGSGKGEREGEMGWKERGRWRKDMYM